MSVPALRLAVEATPDEVRLDKLERAMDALVELVFDLRYAVEEGTHEAVHSAIWDARSRLLDWRDSGPLLETPPRRPRDD